MKKLITNVIAALWPPLFRGGLGLLMTSFAMCCLKAVCALWVFSAKPALSAANGRSK